MNEWNLSKARKVVRQWFAVAAMLALALGCAEDPKARVAERPDPHAQTIVLPGSAETIASLGIATWRYQPTEDGVVVRGLAVNAAESDAPLARFWIAQGETADEMIAYQTGNADAVTLLRAGGARGGGEAFRRAAVAFRADVENEEKAAAKGGARNINDDVYLCLNHQATVTTWSFWATTKILISNPSSSVWVKLSFRAGDGYEENWIPAGSETRFERAYEAAPVTVKYTDYYDGAPPCMVRVRTWRVARRAAGSSRRSSAAQRGADKSENGAPVPVLCATTTTTIERRGANHDERMEHEQSR
jgi:hypothetical protein